jgi:hypothetical protein
MKFKEKKLRFMLIILIGFILILASTIFVAGNSTFFNDTISQTGEVIGKTMENIIEVTSKIEVWADTFINIKTKENMANVSLYLDNGSALPNQEIEFYLDKSLIASQLTDAKGYTELVFNSNVSPGTYSFRVEFKGNPSLYLNPSFSEEQIEIIELNGTEVTPLLILNITNQTLLNQTILNITNQTLLNQTIELNISLKEGVCKNFTDIVLFSSGYTHKKKGSTNYETWKIQTNCTVAGGQDCSLHNVNTRSRILYASPYDEEIVGEGYVQISKLDSSDCDNPEKEGYSKYLVHDTLEEEGGKWERYCGSNKTSDSKCDSKNSYNQEEESTCYGIKTYASQYSIVDVVEISYTWCWGEIDG